ncbi:TAXI family TRAP transporter solute-binding subunit [Roseibium sp. SCPC15]|uniref:TAXI family TRAP transporter solute-binding subunit n=1 Tax=Roseibium sp. SCP15 TaxID=3141376 RepID=UPI00333D7761
MKKILATLGIITTATLVPVSGQATDKTQISLITGPFGTGSYVLGNAVEQIVAKHSDKVQVTSSETPGLVYNAKQLNRDPDMKKNTFMAFTTGINYLATSGQKPFDNKLPDVKLIGNYLLGSVWLATFDPGIKSAADLEGKTIALGRPPQILWTIEPMHIIRDGWQMEDKITIERLGTKDAAQALLNGSVDAAIVGGYADPLTGEFKPSPQTVELLAAGKKLYHIPWGKDAVQAVIDKGIAMNHLSVPAGSVEGVDSDLDGFFDAIAWVSYPELDDDAAYEVTRTLIDNVGQFGDYHALGKLMSAKSLAYGWDPENIHPGALRAYREAGIIE